MRFQQFLELIQEGEGLQVEFKRKVTSADRVAREMIAFANTKGGTMLFGVDDDKTIVGVESEKGELEYILPAAQELCDPPVEHEVQIFSTHGLDVVCVHIPESKDKPHFLMDGEDPPRAFVRVGEHSVTASKEMIKVMKHRAGKTGPVRLVVGEAEKRLFDYFKKNERITVKEYSDLINVSERRASRLLVRLVRAGVVAIHTMEKTDYFTLIQESA
ncbi:MAG: transcriptional regulator [Ectothiorhodospiraceae bacterium]|nr:transcriptional regulator [Ectothiorhodospiraceae bacterium]